MIFLVFNAHMILITTTTTKQSVTSHLISNGCLKNALEAKSRFPSHNNKNKHYTFDGLIAHAQENKQQSVIAPHLISQGVKFCTLD